MPRILFIGPYPPPYSGPELGMKLFLESSLQDRFEIHFLCTNVRRSNVNKGKAGFAMLVAFARFFALLLWKLLLLRPAVVYYPVTATELGWVGRDIGCLAFAHLFRARTIIHLRASHFRLNFQHFHRLTKRLVRAVLKRVDRAIVQSDGLHDQFADLVPASRIRTLPQAIDSERYQNKHPDEYRRGKVLFVGHLTQAKGFCDVLAAMPAIVKECPEAHFFFAGTMRRGERNVRFNQITGTALHYEDPFEAERRILASELAPRYHNLGVLGGEEKIKHFHSADIFVLPSYSEGFSRAVVEALCCGKPVVYTPVGAHRDALTPQIGACVQPGDRTALADAITGLLTDRTQRDRIGARNAEFARENFDISKIADQFGDIIDECLR